MSSATVVVEYKATSVNDQMLHLRLGDVVTVITKSDRDRWWLVEHAGRQGYYPAICLKEFSDSSGQSNTHSNPASVSHSSCRITPSAGTSPSPAPPLASTREPPSQMQRGNGFISMAKNNIFCISKAGEPHKVKSPGMATGITQIDVTPFPTGAHTASASPASEAGSAEMPISATSTSAIMAAAATATAASPAWFGDGPTASTVSYSTNSVNNNGSNSGTNSGSIGSTVVVLTAADKLIDEEGHPLPEGWRRHYDKSTGKFFYANKAAGKSQWSRPDPPLPPSRDLGGRDFEKESLVVAALQQHDGLNAPGTKSRRRRSSVEMAAMIDDSFVMSRHFGPTNETINGVKDLHLESESASPMEPVASMAIPAYKPPPPPPPKRPAPPPPPPLKKPPQDERQVDATATAASLVSSHSSQPSPASPSSSLPPPRPPIPQTEPTQQIDNTAPKRIVTTLKYDLEQFSIQNYAQQYFNQHKKWFLFVRRDMSVDEVLSYSPGRLQTSLTKLPKSSLGAALDLFRKINEYIKPGFPSDISLLRSILVDVNTMSMVDKFFSDEAYCQALKQCTNNPSPESTERCWHLLLALSLCFLPSKDLAKYICKQARGKRLAGPPLSGLAVTVYKRAYYVLQDTEGAKHYELTLSKPTAISFEQNIEPLLNYYISPQIFGSSLENLILLDAYLSEQKAEAEANAGIQCGKDPTYLKLLPLPLLNEVQESPRVPVFLDAVCDAIIRLGAGTKSGIFREAANVNEVRRFCTMIDSGNFDCITRASLHPPASDTGNVVTDVLVACDILKIWLRRLPEPLCTYRAYDRCVAAGVAREESAAQAALELLPPLNLVALKRLCMFMRHLSRHSDVTMMDVMNLVLVFAPNCIRSPSGDAMQFAVNAEKEKFCFKMFVDILAPA